MNDLLERMNAWFYENPEVDRGDYLFVFRVHRNPPKRKFSGAWLGFRFTITSSECSLVSVGLRTEASGWRVLAGLHEALVFFRKPWAVVVPSELVPRKL